MKIHENIFGPVVLAAHVVVEHRDVDEVIQLLVPAASSRVTCNVSRVRYQSRSKASRHLGLRVLLRILVLAFSLPSVSLQYGSLLVPPSMAITPRACSTLRVTCLVSRVTCYLHHQHVHQTRHLQILPCVLLRPQDLNYFLC